MPNLTIIIPHYNTPRLLKKLLEGIPITPDIQVIVIDDNSNLDADCYKSLCDAHRHVTFLANDTGKNSAGTCRNIGLKHAKGRWVLFADADDYFTDDFYAIVSEYFESEYDIIYFPPTSVDLDTGDISTKHIAHANLVNKYIQDRSRESELSLKYNYKSPCSKLISYGCISINDIRFEDTLVANDAMFSTILARHANKVTASDKTIYNITARKGSLTTTINEDSLFARLDVFVRRHRYLKEHLSKEDFYLLDFSGGGIIASAILGRYPLKTVLRMLVLLKKNKVRFFSRKLLNPAVFVSRLRGYIKKNKKGYHTYNKG